MMEVAVRRLPRGIRDVVEVAVRRLPRGIRDVVEVDKHVIRANERGPDVLKSEKSTSP